ncbi:hypothetical protein Droror1_Dr00005265 [Drosera rotundifolia]
MSSSSDESFEVLCFIQICMSYTFFECQKQQPSYSTLEQTIQNRFPNLAAEYSARLRANGAPLRSAEVHVKIVTYLFHKKIASRMVHMKIAPMAQSHAGGRSFVQ